MKLVLLGDGRMGHEVLRAAERAGHTVHALLGEDVLTSTDLAAHMAGADVAVDFTVAEQVPRSVRAAAEAGVDLVVGTTGWRAGEVDFSALGAAGHGVVHGANFSLGVHVFLRLVREASRLAAAAGGYDVHVEEIHHKHKRDHPSGTAIRVAEAVLAEQAEKARWEEGPPHGPPDASVLYVTSVRAGEVPGTHVVGLEGHDDRLELRHEAKSRAGFAAGAVRAAEWIHGRRGVHSFDEVVRDLLDPPSAEGTAGAST